ncbi:hypothetical protein CDD83_4601 [Cordyceps sp. RAO-2017]|nr:hypothetical protein CDD83_4601 [Cordyceps sp. RAO-2017]
MRPHAALSAARALVDILAAVVARNRFVPPHSADRACNLYLRLVGDRDRGFVVDELGLIPEAASSFLPDLEAVQEQIGYHGHPPSYGNKLSNLLADLRRTHPPRP